MFANWPRGRFEKAESLEQLRILENGEDIHLIETKMSQTAINSPDDLKKMQKV
jgi:CMP-2-keto-3-deoxyoctulosonic acid synthetase